MASVSSTTALVILLIGMDELTAFFRIYLLIRGMDVAVLDDDIWIRLLFHPKGFEAIWL